MGMDVGCDLCVGSRMYELDVFVVLAQLDTAWSAT